MYDCVRNEVATVESIHSEECALALQKRELMIQCTCTRTMQHSAL